MLANQLKQQITQHAQPGIGYNQAQFIHQSYAPVLGYHHVSHATRRTYQIILLDTMIRKFVWDAIIADVMQSKPQGTFRLGNKAYQAQ